MDVFDPSRLPTSDGSRSAAPLLPVVDRRDLVTRVRNYRRSCDACPTGWQTYFQVLAAEIERQMPQ